MKRIFLLLVLALFIYEGIALMNAAPGDTISEIMWAASQRPLIPFAFGVLCGHFFWQRKPKEGA